MGWEHVIPQFGLQALDLIAAHPSGPLPFDIKGGGEQTRAFCHVDDFVEGVIAMLAYGKHMNVYHIGNPEEITIASLARKVAVHFGREVTLKTVEVFAGETARRCPDISKLRKLGYTPRVGLETGLGSTLDWYRAHLNLRNDRLKPA
jgi:nucleoside-diphosphate-sugar epimerase